MSKWGLGFFNHVLIFTTKKSGSISLSQFTICLKNELNHHTFISFHLKWNWNLKNELNHHTFISFHLKWNWNHYVIAMFICSQVLH